MDSFDATELARSLAGLERSPVPAWVLDPEALRIRWANDAALELWRAPERDELLARDFSGGPPAVVTRLATAVAAVREGRAFWDEWTFFPRGTPARMKIHFAPVPLGDGRIGVLHHVLPRDEGPPPEQLRGIEALTLTSLVVALVEFTGAVVMKNPAAIACFGRAADDWRAWLAEPDEAEALLREAAEGRVARREALVRAEAGQRIHAIEVQPVRDAVTGRMMALVHHTDETARRGAEVEARRHARLTEELQASLTLVDHQRREILALSAPLLEIGEGALALPLIGVFDAERSQEVAARLLPAIGARQARVVILDLTGVAALDAAAAEQLTRLVRAVRLLGASPILSGVGAALARDLVAANFHLEAVPFVRSLAAAMRLSQRQA